MLNLYNIQSNDLLFDSRYKLISKIGGGGFSEVWLSNDTTSAVNVVLKVYSDASDLNEDGVDMFRKEFATVCNLNHTNILKPFTFDIYQDCPYIVLPYCENGSASNLIGKISEEDIWDFISQVAEGLSHLHAHNIIHKDIKPANVLINHDHQYMITDFGISTGLRNTVRTNTAPLEGTFAYMSYESLGPKPINVMARDIWALGATIYELITGDVPFGQLGGLTQKSNNGAIPKIEVKISDQLRQLINRCLAFDPWDRPSADEIILWSHNRKLIRGKSLIKKDFNSKYIVSALAGCLGLLIVTLNLFGFKWRFEPTYEQDMAIITNSNDSILMAKVMEAKGIVDLEKAKQHDKRIESNLCEAAELYREAMKIEASDSISLQCEALWAESQDVIDKTFEWFQNRTQYYSSLQAWDASSQFRKRSEALKPYITEKYNEINQY